MSKIVACATCGSPGADGAAFCCNCGTALPRSGNSEVTALAPQDLQRTMVSSTDRPNPVTAVVASFAGMEWGINVQQAMTTLRNSGFSCTAGGSLYAFVARGKLYQKKAEVYPVFEAGRLHEICVAISCAGSFWNTFEELVDTLSDKYGEPIDLDDTSMRSWCSLEVTGGAHVMVWANTDDYDSVQILYESPERYARRRAEFAAKREAERSRAHDLL